MSHSSLPVPPPPRCGAADNDDGSSSSAVYAAADFPPLNLFDETCRYPAVSMVCRHTAACKKALKSILYTGGKNVYTDPNDANRRILVLRVGVTEEMVAPLIVNVAAAAVAAPMEEEDVQWIPEQFPVTRHYGDMTAEQVLRKLLLVDRIDEIPSSFELVGHLAHVNLRTDCLPYKYWIGKVLLDKHSAAVRTVVNKIGTIDSVYRTFDMEVLAGHATEPDWSVTTVQEHGHLFQLDYRHVYWNSRLSGEHQRLVQWIRRDAAAASASVDSNRTVVVADLMAGVGPFAVPLTATRGHPTAAPRTTATTTATATATTSTVPKANNNITVYANDLNPVSYQYLKVNAVKNKCVNLHCSNMDARAFLHQLQTRVERVDHVIMNLPASAPEFLNAFQGWTLSTLPMVHVQCFAPKPNYYNNNSNNNNGGTAGRSSSNGSSDRDPNQMALDRCVAALGCPITVVHDQVTVHTVRDVSPGKNMLCVSFRLPAAVRQQPQIDTTTTNSETITDRAVVDNDDDDDNVRAQDSPQLKRTKLND